MDRLYVRLLVVLLTAFYTVSGMPIKDVLVSSYYQTMKNAKLNSNKKSSIIRLYSKSLSSFVRITATTMDATQSNNKSNPDTLIQLESLGPRRVLIKSKIHGTYVCFNNKSDVVIQKKNMGVKCVFLKQIDRKNYVMFQSAYNNTWYLGFSLRNSGLPKSGRKTSSKQRSIQFVETSI